MLWHVNEDLKKFRGVSLKSRIALAVTPEMYLATTLRDFTDNKSGLKPSRKILTRIVRHFYGKALVSIKSSLTCYLPAEEELKEIRERYNVSSEKYSFITLSDITSTAIIRINRDVFDPDKEMGGLRNKEVLHDTTLLHDVKGDITDLLYCKYQGPSKKEGDLSLALNPLQC